MGTVSIVSVSQVLRISMALAQVVFIVIDTIRCQDYGSVNLDTVDPLSLSWNQIHWLVKGQIQEVEELKAEHDEIYNEITGCYGLEKCLAEFDLLNISPGSKLWGLGLRKMDLSMSTLTRQREEVEQTHIRLDAEMRERQRQLVHQEESKLQDLERKRDIRWKQQKLCWKLTPDSNLPHPPAPAGQLLPPPIPEMEVADLPRADHLRGKLPGVAASFLTQVLYTARSHKFMKGDMNTALNRNMVPSSHPSQLKARENSLLVCPAELLILLTR